MRRGQGCRAQDRPCGRCPVAHQGAVRQLAATPGSGEPAHKKEAATGHPGQNLSPGSAAQPQESASEGTAWPLPRRHPTPRLRGPTRPLSPGTWDTHKAAEKSKRHTRQPRGLTGPDHGHVGRKGRLQSVPRGGGFERGPSCGRGKPPATSARWGPQPHTLLGGVWGDPGALVFIGGLRSIKVGQEATQVSTDNDGQTSDPFTLSLGRRTSDPAATRVNPEGTAPRGRVPPDSTHEAPRTQASQSHGHRKQNGGREAGGGGRLEFKGDEFLFQRLSFEGGRRWRLGGTPLRFASSSGSKVNDCN